MHSGAVLRGAAHPEPDIAEITFNFWYILAEELAGSGRALDDAQRTEGRRLFAPAFTQLLDALHSLAELPAESTSWSADQHDEYKRFRYAVGDAITDVCKVLSPTVCLERTFAQLQGVLPGLAAAPAEGWRRAECCVWCKRQMVSNGDPTFFGAEVVGQLMRLLPALPAAGAAVAARVYTASGASRSASRAKRRKNSSRWPRWPGRTCSRACRSSRCGSRRASIGIGGA